MWGSRLSQRWRTRWTECCSQSETHGINQKVCHAVEYNSCLSDSLLFNMTNNLAESFNAIICKEIVWSSQAIVYAFSTHGRVAGAVVQYNRQQVLTKYHDSVGRIVPPIVQELEKRRQTKIARMTKARAVWRAGRCCTATKLIPHEKRKGLLLFLFRVSLWHPSYTGPVLWFR